LKTVVIVGARLTSCLFHARERPTLKSVTKMLSALNKRFELTNLNADDKGLIDSLTLISPDDFAALDICYTGGAEVLEQGAVLVGDLKKLGTDELPPVPLGRNQAIRRPFRRATL